MTRDRIAFVAVLALVIGAAGVIRYYLKGWPAELRGTQVVELELPAEGNEEGTPSARVVLVEIGDMTCPYCERFATGVCPS